MTKKRKNYKLKEAEIEFRKGLSKKLVIGIICN